MYLEIKIEETYINNDCFLNKFITVKKAEEFGFTELSKKLENLYNKELYNTIGFEADDNLSISRQLVTKTYFFNHKN